VGGCPPNQGGGTPVGCLAVQRAWVCPAPCPPGCLPPQHPMGDSGCLKGGFNAGQFTCGSVRALVHLVDASDGWGLGRSCSCAVVGSGSGLFGSPCSGKAWDGSAFLRVCMFSAGVR
jgi:hypothetical protein